MKSNEVRERFLSFFEERGHRRVPSSSLIPAQDPTLLFTNAGMVQFKDVFTGRESREYSRATSSQKCVRAGGKHNDLDNVGYTGRHHTFFEMLGNFSFGDYFKEDAIRFAWELLTDREKGYGLEPDRLWATVFLSDDDAAKIWERYLPPARILRFGEVENFWAMGETGPCGPCSEIHYFRGSDLSQNTAALVNGPGDETVEIWNLVFMQFERDASGKLEPLPRPSVDTGAGLERLAAVLQGVGNNFDTDLLRPIIGEIERISGRAYLGAMADEDAPFRVVADHARSVTMLMADGVMPSNEGRGYVLKRIIRRATRYARQLGIEGPVLHALVPGVVASFAGVHFTPDEAALAVERIGPPLRAEEERFARTLSAGEALVSEEIERLRRSGKRALPGDVLFRLYDTHGIPVDVIEEIARDEGLKVDRQGFEVAMDGQRVRSRATAKFEATDVSVYDRLDLPPNKTVALKGEAATVSAGGVAPGHSEFRGYPEHDFVSLDGARIVGLVKDGAPAARLEAGETGEAVADRTVFYPEGGGQVADTGTWTWPKGEADVLHVWKPRPDTIAHRIRVTRGALEKGTAVNMRVPEWVRRRTQANHTGTHLVHAALRKVLGGGARQMGSLVAPDRLRFDYATAAPPTSEQITEIESLVNQEILRDHEVTKSNLPMDEARRRGADMFFWDKYSDSVRVVEVPGFSIELCGGCHVPRTGEIGAFKIVSDKSLAAGVRRLEAVTSLGAVDLLRADEDTLNRLASAAQTPRENLLERWEEREERLKGLERELASLKMKLASGAGGGHEPSEEVEGVSVVTRLVEGLTVPELRNLSDTLRSRLAGGGVVIVGTSGAGKTSVVIAVTPELQDRVPASRVAALVGKALGGSGGGKADLAQAGGKREELLREGIRAGKEAVLEILAGARAAALEA
ncbi:MAG: alanine--tRNA ligase [Acidobacteriota bacterium]|nr:alanine--tRNA ligase [Acidobacteriota bacterium]